MYQTPLMRKGNQTVAIDNDNSSSKTLTLRVVSDQTGVYPELLHSGTVVSSTTAVVLESELERGTEMGGNVILKWDESIASVTIEGWTVDERERFAKKEFFASEDIMQKDSAFTVNCVLADTGTPASDPPSGWTGPSSKGIWTLDPYVRLRRKTYTLTQTT